MSESRGVYLLSAEHAEGLRVLSGDPDFAAAAAISLAPSVDDIADYVATALKAREEGRSWVFALTDRAELLGVCRLIGVLGVPRLIVAIGRAHRGKGNGSFAVDKVLEFAFGNLRLERVTASGACLRLLAQFGELLGGQELTRQEWLGARARAVRQALHPSLIPILDAELAAGNEVAELRTGWPDPDSVFVRLLQSFLADHRGPPADVTFTELVDPHWWKAEYSSTNPRHVLAS